MQPMLQLGEAHGEIAPADVRCPALQHCLSQPSPEPSIPALTRTSAAIGIPSNESTTVGAVPGDGEYTSPYMAAADGAALSTMSEVKPALKMAPNAASAGRDARRHPISARSIPVNWNWPAEYGVQYALKLTLLLEPRGRGLGRGLQCSGRRLSYGG